MKQAAIRRIKREVAKRCKFNKIEKPKLISNMSKVLSKVHKNEIRLEFKNVKRNISIKSSFRNHCLISGRAHSIYSHYKLSRNEMRRFIHKGLLYGITKASW
jgi:ribosomal protein S14